MKALKIERYPLYNKNATRKIMSNKNSRLKIHSSRPAGGDYTGCLLTRSHVPFRCRYMETCLREWLPALNVCPAPISVAGTCSCFSDLEYRSCGILRDFMKSRTKHL